METIIIFVFGIFVGFIATKLYLEKKYKNPVPKTTSYSSVDTKSKDLDKDVKPE